MATLFNIYRFEDANLVKQETYSVTDFDDVRDWIVTGLEFEFKGSRIIVISESQTERSYTLNVIIRGKDETERHITFLVLK